MKTRFFNVPCTEGTDNDIIRLRFKHRLNWAKYVRALVREDIKKEKPLYPKFSTLPK